MTRFQRKGERISPWGQPRFTRILLVAFLYSPHIIFPLNNIPLTSSCLPLTSLSLPLIPWPHLAFPSHHFSFNLHSLTPSSYHLTFPSLHLVFHWNTLPSYFSSSLLHLTLKFSISCYDLLRTSLLRLKRIKKQLQSRADLGFFPRGGAKVFFLTGGGG